MDSESNDTMQKEYALVTGAGRGLGKCYTEELAKRGMNIILVGLHLDELDEVATELRSEFGIETAQIQCDLSIKDEIVTMAKEVNSKYAVSTLINNAGLGGSKKYVDADVDYVNQIIQVNVMGTALVTHQLLPNLLKQPKGYILNVSSIAAYSPMGFKTVYPASKAFIDHFSHG
ncbi:MAG: short-subunit dehydrogenase, partial [Granulosicoccus sp.]